MGPIEPASFQGTNRYSIMVFLDDYSKLTKMYCIKTKDGLGECLEKYLVTTRNLLENIKELYYVGFDRGTEFAGRKSKEVMHLEKVKLNMGPPSTSQHN